jgi:hypothetical protein
MAYMIYQRYTTAVLEAYADDPDVVHHLEAARSYRIWLATLTLEPAVKSALVEQALVIESAFERLAANRQAHRVE